MRRRGSSHNIPHDLREGRKGLHRPLGLAYQTHILSQRGLHSANYPKQRQNDIYYLGVKLSNYATRTRN